MKEKITMKKYKIIVFVGSARKKHTHSAAGAILAEIETNLKEKQKNSELESEIICLKDYTVKTCLGCKICFDNGESWCPLKDDRDLLLKNMMDADGIIFATPVYSFQVSSMMKIFIDRFAFLFHRPCMFGKTFMSIAVQGTYGGKDAIKYLNFIGQAMGCNTVKGGVIQSLEPMTESGNLRNQRLIQDLGKKFALKLVTAGLPKPSLFKLMIFRLSRTSMKLMLDEEFEDFRYYSKQGWFDSDYYYPVKLSLFQRAVGRLADLVGKNMAKSR